MKLNGWQRLWVVASALWMVFVVTIGFLGWPSAGQVPGAEVYSHMSEESLRLLQDYKPDRRPLLAAGPAGAFTAFPPDASDDQLRTFLRQHLSRQDGAGTQEIVSPAGIKVKFPADVSADEVVVVLKQNGYLNQPDWFAANAPNAAASTIPPFTALATSISYDGLGNRILAFWSGVSSDDVRRVREEYGIAMDAALQSKRAGLIGWLALLWIAPAFGVYLLGWAAAWIRAGFSRRGRQTS